MSDLDDTEILLVAQALWERQASLVTGGPIKSYVWDDDTADHYKILAMHALYALQQYREAHGTPVEPPVQPTPSPTTAGASCMEGRVRELLAEWDQVDLTLPGHPHEPATETQYRAGFHAAISLARQHLRAAVEGHPPVTH